MKFFLFPLNNFLALGEKVYCHHHIYLRNVLFIKIIIVIFHFQTNKLKNHAMPEILDIIFAGYKMPEYILDERISRIKWVSLKNYDLQTATQVICEAIIDQSITKNIVICAYQKWAGAIENSKITKCFDEIVATYKAQERNKIVFSTFWYLPNSSSVWKQVRDLNDKVRFYNEMIDMPQLCMHKMGTTWVSECDRTLRIRGMVFIEFQLGIGLGHSLSVEGLLKVKNYLLVAMDITFSPNAEKKRVRYARAVAPPPLIETEGYRFNEFFKQELRDRNLAGRPASTGGSRSNNLTWSQRRPEGWRNWDVYRKNPCWTKEERMRALEQHLELINRSDERPVWGKAKQVPKAQHVPEEVKEEEDLIVFSEGEQDDVFDEAAEREVEILTKELSLNDDKEVEIEYNEDEHDIYMEGEDDGIDRYNRVNEELVAQYRKELASKTAQIVKEKAASKHWRHEADKSDNANNTLVKDVEYYKRRCQVLEAQLKRVQDEYKFLKGLYEDGSRMKVSGRQYAKSGDFRKVKK